MGRRILSVRLWYMEWGRRENMLGVRKINVKDSPPTGSFHLPKVHRSY